MAEKDCVAVLLEEIRDQNKAVLENVTNLPTRRDFEALHQDVNELKQDVRVVKAAVTDLSDQVADHEQRMARLESA